MADGDLPAGQLGERDGALQAVGAKHIQGSQVDHRPHLVVDDLIAVSWARTKPIKPFGGDGAGSRFDMAGAPG
ncbi:MAG: hypothetical protein GWP48_05465 [Actinobacteria bacterium]|nr:hypothetical protein [Actinomycetota bacterium]